MKRQKRKLTAAALIAVLLALCVQASLAYYTVRGTATNVVTSGGVQMGQGEDIYIDVSSYFK